MSGIDPAFSALVEMSTTGFKNKSSKILKQNSSQIAVYKILYEHTLQDFIDIIGPEGAAFRRHLAMKKNRNAGKKNGE